MINLNRVIVAGRLVRDPEIRRTVNGATVARFTIAVKSRRARNKRTDYIDVVAWDKLSDNSGAYLRKGKAVLVVGRLSIQRFESKSGEKRKAAEVVMASMQMLDPWRDSRTDPQDKGPSCDQDPALDVRYRLT